MAHHIRLVPIAQDVDLMALLKSDGSIMGVAERVAAYTPTGAVTAGFFNPALTIFDNVTKGGRIFFEGGYNNPYSKVKTQIELLLKGMG